MNCFKKKVHLFLWLLLLPVLSYAQTAITGTVTDATGETVVGANVVEKGTRNSTATDIDGKFTLTVAGNAVLQVSFLGYVTQEVAAAPNMTVVLAEDTKALDEVVVVAFGTTKREAFTGSVGIVGSESIKLSQQTNPVQTLAGKVAGVQLANESGQFGTSPKVLIRGFGSISSGNEPLYVIDGMPFDGDMNNLNPADIETMTVLKDAASNALYGARGANGVIMITTKKAGSGEAKITFDMRMGVNSVAMKTYDYIKDPALWYETYYKSVYNQRISLGDDPATARATTLSTVAASNSYRPYTVPNGQDFITADGKLNPAATLGRLVSYDGKDYWLQPDDWLKEGTKTGLRQEYNLSVSGSEGKINYLASLSYLKNEGITDGSSIDRLTARFKGEYQAKKWLRVGSNINYTNNTYNQSSEGIIGSSGSVWSMVTAFGPIFPVYIRDANKNLVRDDYGQIMYDFGNTAGLDRGSFNGSNPIFTYKYNKSHTSVNAWTANGFADINFTSDLKLTINGGVYNSESRYTYVADPYAQLYSTTSDGGYVSKSHDRSLSYNLQQILNYAKDFDKHTVSLMAGHEYYNYTYAYLSAVKTKMFSSDNDELNGAVNDNGVSESYRSIYNNEGFFFRGQYNYADKYFFSGSFRRDASSRFAPENRWGNFWSLGGAWLVNKESWFAALNAPFVNLLKLKASIGSQGNDNIGSYLDDTGNYLYEDQYDVENASGEISLVFRQKGNRKITWETNTNTNAGLEFSLFKNRLNVTFDYFYRLTSDMLFEFFVAPSNGYTSYFDNLGDMRNRGFELDVNGDVIRTKDFVWNVNFNVTKVSNKILFLPAERKTLSVEGYDGYTWAENRFAYPSVFFIGEDIPLYTFYGRKYAGVNEEGISTWYKDVKNAAGEVTGRETTLVYSEATDYLLGSALPDAYGGFGTTLQYKGFDFAINFNYQLGGQVFDFGYANSMSSPSGNFSGNIHKDMLTAWSPENTSSNIPRLNGGDPNQGASSGSVVDRYLANASYLNLQNLNVGYTLPTTLTSKFGISSLRVYVSVENLWYLSTRRGLDPRYSFFGSTNNQVYSPIRTVSGGLTVQL
jgi:TonB-linked SusC/RagA family outer membrane protein